MPDDVLSEKGSLRILWTDLSNVIPSTSANSSESGLQFRSPASTVGIPPPPGLARSRTPLMSVGGRAIDR